MSNPTPSDAHINKPLTNVMINWQMNTGRFAYNRAFPSVPVDKQSDRYFIWDRADVYRDEAGEIGPGDAAPEIVSRLSDSSYYCKVHGVAAKVPDQTARNADSPLNLKRNATRRVTSKTMLKKEKIWVANCFTTGKWSTDLQGSVDFTQFAAPGTGSPVTFIRQEMIKPFVLLGFDPKDLVLTIGYEVFETFLDHTDFLERYENTQTAILNQQLMAAVLGIKEVVVAMASENTAAEGKDAVMQFTHADSMLMTYAPAAPSIEEPSAGYTFQWTGLFPGSTGVGIWSWYDMKHKTEYVEAQIACTSHITAPELGIFAYDCLA